MNSPQYYLQMSPEMHVHKKDHIITIYELKTMGLHCVTRGEYPEPEDKGQMVGLEEDSQKHASTSWFYIDLARPSEMLEEATNAEFDVVSMRPLNTLFF